MGDETAVIENLTLNNADSNGFGSVASRLMCNGLNINALRTNAVLHKDEWEQFDAVVVEVARSRLVGIADLQDANLVVSIPNAMGVTTVQHETMSDMSDASIDMSGLTEAEADRVLFQPVNTPLPIIHKDFHISLRNLSSSRRLGLPLDTTQIAVATRRVADRMEDLLFNGTTVGAGGGTIWGYTNAPTRNTGTVAASWALAATAGTSILDDLLAMIAIAQSDNMFGPYQLYVSVPVYTRLLNDFKTNSDKSILGRILEIPDIRGIKSTTRLSGTNVLLVQFTSDVVDLLDGLQPTPVFWETQGGMMLNFKVMAITAPRVKADQSGRSGIVHFS